MNVLLIVSAVAGFSSAIGHSYLSERFVLGPLLAAPGDNRIWRSAANHRLMRALWHLPSLAWAQTATVTLWVALTPETLEAQATAVLAYFGVGIYGTAAVINALCMQKPHVGNILLSIAALALWFGLYG